MKILLIIPPFKEIIYAGSIVRSSVPGAPLLGVSVLAGALLRERHSVRILDLNLCGDYSTRLSQELSAYEPDYAGITFVTPLFGIMSSVTDLVKRQRPGTIVIGGGPHATALPEDTLKSSRLDMVVIGEGDHVLPEIVSGKPLAQIQGIAYRKNGAITVNPPSAHIQDLDALAMPAWQLYEVSRYRSPGLMARRNPAGWIETSRGCPFNCCFCSKSVFGHVFRAKSLGRVIQEIRHTLGAGFKEIHIADDMFTTDISRVKNICREILNQRLDFPWATVTGIRVDRGDREMFDLMARAGCYRVSFGIESGNQSLLDAIGKGIRLEQVESSVAMAKQAGLETCGFFMLALPGETVATMRETLEFACKLDLDWAKACIMTPLPGTRIYEELKTAGRLRIKDWSQYNLYKPTNEIFDHPELDWPTVDRHFRAFYRGFYFRPRLIARKILKGIKHGTMLSDILQFSRTDWC